MRQKKQNLSIITLPALLAAVFLIKVGAFALWLLKLIWRVIKLPSKKKFKGQIIFKKKRGRPRISSWWEFYSKKSKRIVNKLIPSPIRIVTLIAIITSAIFGYSYFLVSITQSLPSPHKLSSFDKPLTTEFYDSDNTLLYKLYEGNNRKLVNLDKLPPHLINATIAIEDKNFYTHAGVDFFGVTRALYQNIIEGELQGASTITQQLIKNTLLTPDRTFRRKIREVALSFWTERIYSKKEILTMYFNEVPYGGPTSGVEAASEMYFGKEAKDLTLAESAYLAGLPAAPSQYSPYGTNPGQGKLRQKEVLRRMVEDGYITENQSDQVAQEELNLISPNLDIKAPHFVMYVRSHLSAKYGTRVVSQGGLKVYTTLDLSLQDISQDIVAEQVKKLGGLGVGNGAAMITEAKTGRILAMVGSYDYNAKDGGNFNVTLALRQPGSSIKPVTYATAFKQGYTPGTVLLDVPTVFADSLGRPYAPVNYDGKFHGAVTIRVALASSYNLPAVKTLALVGLPAMFETARDLGISTFDDPKNYGLSATLGGAAVKMIDMMGVYGTFAASGLRHTPNPIRYITDSAGNILEDHRQVEGKRVLTQEVAYLITHILSDNKARIPAFGKDNLLEIPGKSVAVKTGTSDDKRDNWTIGYTPEYVVGVWVGNNNNAPMHPSLTSGVTGATPIWHDIMVVLTQNKPDMAFIKPQGIVETSSDLAISGQVPKQVVAYKKSKKEDHFGSEQEVITYTDPFSKIPVDKFLGH